VRFRGDGGVSQVRGAEGAARKESISSHDECEYRTESKIRHDATCSHISYESWMILYFTSLHCVPKPSRQPIARVQVRITRFRVLFSPRNLLLYHIYALHHGSRRLTSHMTLVWIRFPWKLRRPSRCFLVSI
jgi:hypothetical protein